MNVMTSQPVAAGRRIAAGPARFSASEFLRMVELDAFGDIGVELIRGVLDRMPPPGNTHAQLQVALLAQLLKLLSQNVVRGEAGIDLGDDTIVACDAAILSQAFEVDGMIPAAIVSLVVEVAVSTRDRDLGLKRHLYAAAGIPTYWVVDVERALVHLFDRPQDGDYAGLALAKFGEPIAVPGTDGAVMLE